MLREQSPVGLGELAEFRSFSARLKPCTEGGRIDEESKAQTGSENSQSLVRLVQGFSFAPPTGLTKKAKPKLAQRTRRVSLF
jgi:hypothetical protein